MSKPAARLGDKHKCPKKIPLPHIGGPIQEGSPNVFINEKSAARLGDKTKCEHDSPDKISSGSSTVTINGKPAARVDDKTEHGGKISAGSGNVFIDSGGWKVDIGDEGKVYFGNEGKIYLSGDAGEDS